MGYVWEMGAEDLASAKQALRTMWQFKYNQYSCVTVDRQIGGSAIPIAWRLPPWHALPLVVDFQVERIKFFPPHNHVRFCPDNMVATPLFNAIDH